MSLCSFCLKKILLFFEIAFVLKENLRRKISYLNLMIRITRFDLFEIMLKKLSNDKPR